MSKTFTRWAVMAFALISFSGAALAQNVPAPVIHDGWGRPMTDLKPTTPGPAKPHDISGTWEPARAPGDGIQGTGSKSMPADGKHEPPYTALGLQTLQKSSVGNGNREVMPADINDPVFFCEPQGMPREDLYELRQTQIVQSPLKTLILYEFNRIWRVVWTDGRDLPKDPESRWYGYSIGKWEDDYTFVVNTIGTDARTWVDKAGRPHTEDLKVEERFHRVDSEHLELTVTIDDPKMYTKPWVAMDKFPMKRLPDDFDVREMICSPSESAAYNQTIGGHTK